MYGKPAYVSESETPHAGEVRTENGGQRYVRHAELGMRGGALGLQRVIAG